MSNHNHRQNVVNRGTMRLCGGDLRSCRGGLTFKFDKNSTNLSCFIFQFVGLGTLYGDPSRGATSSSFRGVGQFS